LFESAVAEASDFQKFLAVFESSGCIAMRNDCFSERLSKPRYTCQQWCGCHVEINTNRVHSVFNHRIERSCQTELINIMLVLADANGFRFNFHEFRQRVLQAAGNGNSTAQ